MKAAKQAFTLIELLLVAAIIGIVTAIVVPSMVKSIRGNRLKLAARTVVRAGKYARSMAVLKQKKMEVIFDLDKGIITIKPFKTVKVAPPEDKKEEQSAGPAFTGISDNSENGPDVSDDKNTGGFTGEQAVIRKLDAVSIVWVEAGDEKQNEGVCSIIYNNNGRCAPYTVQLQDDAGYEMNIEVDALAAAQVNAL